MPLLTKTLNIDKPLNKCFCKNIIEPTRRVHLLRKDHRFTQPSWFKYAAVILLMLSVAAAYLYFNSRSASREQTVTQNNPVKNDISPGGNRATLTLADGTVVILDECSQWSHCAARQFKIIKKDGEVIYNSTSNTVTTSGINTMRTPRGGQYQLTLPDGTKAWLNAASRITYPTIFKDNTREVENYRRSLL